MLPDDLKTSLARRITRAAQGSSTQWEPAFSVSLANHEGTGFTRHYSEGQVLPMPASLQIVRPSSGGGVYLIYLDATNVEMTDTFHANVEEAFAQAASEFGVLPSEWQAVEHTE
jgi:hypothetical protein